MTHHFAGDRQRINGFPRTGLFVTAITCVQIIASFGFVQANAFSVAQDRGTLVAILDDNLPGFDGEFVKMLAADLRKSGWEVETLSASQVCDPNVLSPAKYFLYVIPQCRTYPAAGLDALIAFASGRGHVLFLGGPLLDDPVWRADAGWLNRAAIQSAKNGAVPDRAPLASRLPDVKLWQRTCSNPTTPGSWELVADGPPGQSCFRFWTKNLSGWDGYLSPDIPQLFAPQHGLLSFLVQGSASTHQLVVEIQEQDGSRWMAVVDVTPQWQRVSLDVHDFAYWHDSPTRDQRGQAGDQLQWPQARRISFQLAQSHIPSIAPGEHSFSVADIGTSVHPLKNLVLTMPAVDKTLESILPRYKVYPVDSPVTFRPTSHPCARRQTSLLRQAAWCAALHGRWAGDFRGIRNGASCRSGTRSITTGNRAALRPGCCSIMPRPLPAVCLPAWVLMMSRR